MGFPAISANGFPGKRCDAYRAGMTPTWAEPKDIHSTETRLSDFSRSSSDGNIITTV